MTPCLPQMFHLRPAIAGLAIALHLLAQAPASGQTIGQDPIAAQQGRDGFEPVTPVDPTSPDSPSDPGPAPDPTPHPDGGSRFCVADLNGNGDAADPGEMAGCDGMAGGAYLCPLQKADCTFDTNGQPLCPFGPQFACVRPGAGGSLKCSPNRCADLRVTPIVTSPPIDDPGAAPDGGIDADGNCLGRIEIFSGRGMRCRPPGAGTTLSNCCKDKGKIIKDGMGSSISSVGTKVAVAKGVFDGMRAAYTAFQAGATAGQAASAGANALVIGFDPTSIAISLAVNFMIDFLFSGCDQQDMETAMLRSSGMCHAVGSYCTASLLGLCLQRARGHCCFNTKLGRILQEQGRTQLKSFNGVGWGTPKNPLCRGFTPEEFQALDFSKMDLSEYYADVEARAQSEIQIDMKDRIDAYLKTVGN